MRPYCAPPTLSGNNISWAHLGGTTQGAASGDRLEQAENARHEFLMSEGCDQKIIRTRLQHFGGVRFGGPRCKDQSAGTTIDWKFRESLHEGCRRCVRKLRVHHQQVEDLRQERADGFFR